MAAGIHSIGHQKHCSRLFAMLQLRPSGVLDTHLVTMDYRKGKRKDHDKKPAVKARKGVNPFTGEEQMFKAKPASTAVKVRALKKLKDMAN